MQQLTLVRACCVCWAPQAQHHPDLHGHRFHDRQGQGSCLALGMASRCSAAPESRANGSQCCLSHLSQRCWPQSYLCQEGVQSRIQSIALLCSCMGGCWRCAKAQQHAMVSRQVRVGMCVCGQLSEELPRGRGLERSLCMCASMQWCGVCDGSQGV